jgi:hypothetical protein
MVSNMKWREPMMIGTHAEPAPTIAVSELVLSDRLIALAKDADRAGYPDTAEHLLGLACSVFDEAAKKTH